MSGFFKNDPKIRVVIAHPSQNSAVYLRKIVESKPQLRVIEMTGTADELVEICRESNPHLVIMNQRLADCENVLDTPLIMDLAVPVILLTGHGYDDLWKEAMQRGARYVLIEPINPKEMHANITQIVTSAAAVALPAANQEKFDGALIAVCGAKGNSGCSVTAVNLAVALQSEQKKTALIDLAFDTGDDHILLDLVPQQTIVSLCNEPELDQETIIYNSAVHSSGLRFFRAPDYIGEASQIHVEDLRRILVEMSEHFDYIIADIGYPNNSLALTALERSDAVLLLTSLNLATISRTTKMLRFFNENQIPQERIFLINTEFNNKKQFKPRHLESHTGKHFFASIPANESVVEDSINNGMPFIINKKRDPVSKAIFDIAHKLAARSLIKTR